MILRDQRFHPPSKPPTVRIIKSLFSPEPSRQLLFNSVWHHHTLCITPMTSPTPQYRMWTRTLCIVILDHTLHTPSSCNVLIPWGGEEEQRSGSTSLVACCYWKLIIIIIIIIRSYSLSYIMTWCHKRMQQQTNASSEISTVVLMTRIINLVEATNLLPPSRYNSKYKACGPPPWESQCWDQTCTTRTPAPATSHHDAQMLDLGRSFLLSLPVLCPLFLVWLLL